MTCFRILLAIRIHNGKPGIRRQDTKDCKDPAGLLDRYCRSDAEQGGKSQVQRASKRCSAGSIGQAVNRGIRRASWLGLHFSADVSTLERQ